MRPKPITILCAILFVLAGIDSVGAIGAFFHISFFKALFRLIITLMGLISTLGLWEMKKWGVFLFLATFFISFSYYYFFETASKDYLIMMFILPAIYLAVVLPYWKRLRS